MGLLRRVGGTIALPAWLCLAGTAAHGQSVPPATPAPAEADEVAADSPRASLVRYLDLCRGGRYAEAAGYLSLTEDQSARGAVLARRLKAVLDRHLWIDLDLVSPLPEGRPADGLPPGSDELGTIPAPGGRKDPVRLMRRVGDDDVRWVFTRGTVDRIDAWYATLPDRWIRERLPEILLRPGPKELLWWQWLALPVLLALAWTAGRILGSFTGRLVKRVAGRTRAEWDDALIAWLRAPLVLGWTIVVATLLAPWLGLYAPAQSFVDTILRTAGLVTLFWGLWRVVDITGRAMAAAAWARDSGSARSLLSLGVRAGKVVVLALGLLATLSQLGYPVAGLIAGLGVGGLAVALAAQKTVENLFGSVSLAADQPFRVGDFVRIEDFLATVEAIGLRSTRFRTLDRTLITIPNGRLADMRLESFTARDRMRLACIIGVVYGTTAAQMRQVLEGLEAVLRGHPQIWPDAVVVRFKEFGASSLDIEIMAWFQTSVWSEFQLIRQEVLLQFMEVVEKAGTSFAFPTRTVHVVKETPLAPA